MSRTRKSCFFGKEGIVRSGLNYFDNRSNSIVQSCVLKLVTHNMMFTFLPILLLSKYDVYFCPSNSLDVFFDFRELSETCALKESINGFLIPSAMLKIVLFCVCTIISYKMHCLSQLIELKNVKAWKIFSHVILHHCQILP